MFLNTHVWFYTNLFALRSYARYVLVTVSVFIYTYHIQLFCDKFTKEKALDKTNLFFGLIHEPIMQLNNGEWLICLL